mmetsp:Transcript_7192/g.15644  ORF Transcript_7192/g.15644 Transcript_7192/m.15644 type:complete len:932 (+) Transcript_7192:226-3021(+)
MIEGEEIFESAQETGYRLCRAKEDSSAAKDAVFSAQWDLNNPDRLFVCLQNGQLRVFDVAANTVDNFDVLFKRYTPIFDNDSSQEKRVTFHWDKMTTIPDRPDEMIFLLGISKALMYTALPPPEDKPYPDEPLLASTSRSDFPGFIFGSPVMEVASHAARVTSMAVSPAGHILATGDELGNVRLLLLRLLEDISVFNRNSQRKKKHSSSTSFSEFLPTYNILHLAHPGPIFSLQWLPIIAASDGVNLRNYALATGSTDRSVRIWRVACSTSRGITITPAMVLDTLSTHVLSLNSYLFTDRFTVAKIHRLEELSMGDADPYSVVSSTQKARKIDQAKSIFIGAGTNVGTIYVWKLEYVDVMDAINPVEDEQRGHTQALLEAEKARRFMIDDGNRLFSLLQTSDRPIIHLSFTSTQMTSEASLQSAVGDIVLAASDTQGVVRVYTPEKIVDKDGFSPEADDQDDLLDSLQRHPLHAEYRSKMSVDEAHVNQRPLVSVGEHNFASPIVCCCFQPAYPKQDTKRETISMWDPSNMTQRSGPLIVGLASGDLNAYNTDDLSVLTHARLSSLHGGDERSIGPMSVVTLGTQYQSIVHASTADSSSVESPKVRILERKGSAMMSVASKISKTSKVSKTRAKGGVKVDSRLERSGEKPMDKRVSYADMNELVMQEQERSMGAKAQGEDQESVPRMRPPPAPTSLPSASAPASVPRSQASLQLDSPPKAVYRAKGDALMSPLTVGSPNFQSLSEGRSKVAQSAGAVSKKINYAGAGQDEVVEQYMYTTERTEHTHTEEVHLRQTETTADARRTSQGTQPQKRNGSARVKLPRAAAEQGSVTLTNDYATAAQTITKALEGDLQKLTHQLDQDDISLSTQRTTQSDRMFALKAATVAPQRYSRLTPMQYLDSADIEALMGAAQKPRAKISKQVDAEWLGDRK